MENRHFYWLKALRQKYAYKELIANLKMINSQLKGEIRQCEFQMLKRQCQRKTRQLYEYENCCSIKKCCHFFCWQHRKKISK